MSLVMVKDIAEYLKTFGISGTISRGAFPNKPDDCVALFQYAGRSPLHEAQLKRPGLQVRTRSKSYETAMSKIVEIENILNLVGDETNGTLPEGIVISETRYIRISSIQAAFPLGRDDNERFEFAQNYNITKE